MVQWKIRPVGQELYIALDVNPSGYGRNKQVEVYYEALTDGGRCRVVAPIEFRKEGFQVIWANLTQDQLDLLQGYVNQKVELQDHLGEVTQVYMDGIEKEYLISGTFEQRYAVKIQVREV